LPSRSSRLARQKIKARGQEKSEALMASPTEWLERLDQLSADEKKIVAEVVLFRLTGRPLSENTAAYLARVEARRAAKKRAH
jgi:hypothetical protein